jgi:hypothetical protein
MALLFSYGTLQQADVQLALFGHLLEGRPDELVGFERSWIEIDEPELVGGKARHAIVRRGADDGRVSGTALEVTEAELAAADAYEPEPYERISTTLASGRPAWVYADGSSS